MRIVLDKLFEGCLLCEKSGTEGPNEIPARFSSSRTEPAIETTLTRNLAGVIWPSFLTLQNYITES